MLAGTTGCAPAIDCELCAGAGAAGVSGLALATAFGAAADLESGLASGFNSGLASFLAAVVRGAGAGGSLIQGSAGAPVVEVGEIGTAGDVLCVLRSGL